MSPLSERMISDMIFLQNSERGNRLPIRTFPKVQAACASIALLGASAAHADDTRFQYPQQYTVSPKGVNLQTGRFMSSKTDLSIGNLDFTRKWGDVPAIAFPSRALGVLATYSQGGQGWRPPNVGWSHNFNQGVQYKPAYTNSLARYYVVVDGRNYTFAELADGTIGPGDQGTQGTRLTWVAGQWNFTDHNGALFTFFVHPAIPQGGATGSPIQLLQSVTYADGKRVDYAYTASAQPRFIKNNSGYAIALDYDGNGNVAAACGFNLSQVYADATTTCASASLKTSYGYDSTGKNLTSVTDTLNQIVTMTYVSPVTNFYFPACISLPGSLTCEITNAYGPNTHGISNYPDQVNTQTTATGDIWIYSYQQQPDPADLPVVMGAPRYSTSRMTDPLGKLYAFKYDRGHLTEQTTPAGTMSYRYAYLKYSVPLNQPTPTTLEYHGDLPQLVIPPEGNREYFAYDTRGNVTQHSYWPKGSPNPAAPLDPALDGCCVLAQVPTHPAGSATYWQGFLGNQGFTTNFGALMVLGCGSGPADAKLCNKPIIRIDANSNTTDFTYDPAHGGVLTETGPAVNGVRPQKRYAYAQRYAWVKNITGAYVQAATPIWVLTQESYCKTGAASGNGCAIAGDEIITQYEYGPNSGPNNLALRGVVQDVGGLALRTCYSYDNAGNKISETSPKAGLTACP